MELAIQDWISLISTLKGLGLLVIEDNRAAGTVLVQVPMQYDTNKESQ